MRTIRPSNNSPKDRRSELLMRPKSQSNQGDNPGLIAVTEDDNTTALTTDANSVLTQDN